VVGGLVGEEILQERRTPHGEGGEIYVLGEMGQIQGGVVVIV
jgi:hypothetical protein